MVNINEKGGPQGRLDGNFNRQGAGWQLQSATATKPNPLLGFSLSIIHLHSWPIAAPLL